MMQVLVNSKAVVIESDTTLSQLVATYYGEAAGYALAVNQQVVPRQLWDSTILSENDQVLAIQATKGG